MASPMADKIYKGYPKKSWQGALDRPFYYGIRKGRIWKYLRITPFPDTKVLSSNKISKNREFKLPRGKKILVFETHSDDAAINTGDFLLKLRKARNHIHIVNLISCHLTVGGNLSLEEKKKIRDGEGREFAGKIGASIQFLRLEFPFTKVKLRVNKTTNFLDLKNCKFGRPGQEDFEKVYQVLASEKPDAILLPHPFDYHQMHSDAANLVLDSIAKLSPRQDSVHLLFYGGGDYFHRFGITANIYNLLSREEAIEKINMRRIFRSQSFIESIEAYLKRDYFRGKRITGKKLDIALCNFFIRSLNRDELKKISRILRKPIKAPYCERFIEFKIERAAIK